MTISRPAPDCLSMVEVRAEIDRIDAMIVTLLADRTAYIDRAAELKPAAGMPARIDQRVEEVVGRVRTKAQLLGLEPELVEKMWRILIDWSIAREETAMAKE